MLTSGTDEPSTRVPELRALQVFLAVIAAGSMTRAGERLGLTQSAVSQSMRRLARQIGTPLLERHGGVLAPTPAGSVLAERAAPMLAEAARLPALSREAAHGVALPHLRLGFVDSFASTAGPALVRQMLDDMQSLRFSAWSGLAPAQADALMQHKLEAVITCDPMDGVDGLVRHELLREPYILLVPEFLAPECAGLDLGALARRHRLVRHSARSHAGAHIERHLRRVGADAPRVLEFDTAEAVIAMVAGGVGWAITTPLCLLHGSAHKGRAVALPLPEPGFSRRLHLIGHANTHLGLQHRIAALARHILAAEVIPRLIAATPWLATKITQSGA
jgi:DNA-binding transcriptional LysR family regulator